MSNKDRKHDILKDNKIPFIHLDTSTIRKVLVTLKSLRVYNKEFLDDKEQKHLKFVEDYLQGLFDEHSEFINNELKSIKKDKRLLEEGMIDAFIDMIILHDIRIKSEQDIKDLFQPLNDKSNKESHSYKRESFYWAFSSIDPKIARNIVRSGFIKSKALRKAAELLVNRYMLVDEESSLFIRNLVDECFLKPETHSLLLDRIKKRKEFSEGNTKEIHSYNILPIDSD